MITIPRLGVHTDIFECSFGKPNVLSIVIFAIPIINLEASFASKYLDDLDIIEPTIMDKGA